MTNTFDRRGSTSLAPFGSESSGGKSLAEMVKAAKDLKNQASAPPAAIDRSVTSLLKKTNEEKKKAKAREEFKQKPLLIYFIIDLTASRKATRSAMREHENEIARLVMESGGDHPVICRGIYYSGSSCSYLHDLETVTQIEYFFDIRPSAGYTRIAEALSVYEKDRIDEVASLAILIGDTADGDDSDELMDLARSLKGSDANKRKPRPIVVAHERTEDPGSADFCENLAPRLARASGGHSFGLSEYPTELIELLKGLRTILQAPPETTKSMGSTNGAKTHFSPTLSHEGREFLAANARRVNYLQLTSGN